MSLRYSKSPTDRQFINMSSLRGNSLEAYFYAAYLCALVPIIRQQFHN